MAKKLTRKQITFDSLLEPAVELDPRVVLVDDPRWRECLDEAKTCKYAGLDSEFYQDGVSSGGDLDDDGRDGVDPFSSSLRLLQLALPSGRVLVADLGGVGDDRAARLRQYGDLGVTQSFVFDGVEVEVPVYVAGSFMQIVRDLVEDETRPKILHNAKIDALMLRVHFGWRARCLRCTMLCSQLYWAGIRGIKHGLGFLSERAVAMQAPQVWLVEKKLQKSEWRWLLSNAQLNYAALDALVVVYIFRWLAGLIRDAGMMPAALAEMGAIPGFVECEYNGMPVNPALLDDHIEMWRRGRELAIAPFLQRYPGVDPAKTQVVAVALSLDDCYGGHVFYELDETKPRRHPVYILGKRFDYAFKTKDDRYVEADDHSVGEAVLTKWNHLPWVSALLDWRSMGVVLKWMESIRRRLKKDARVRGEYAQIAGGENRKGDDADGKGMGRSACRQPSLQQSANPQPKLSALIHRAMRFTGDVMPMSPRLPFVGHDEYAAAYLRWAAARLRGETPDPFRELDRSDATASGRGAESAPVALGTSKGVGEVGQPLGDVAAAPSASQSKTPVVVVGDLDTESGDEVEPSITAPEDALTRAAWYDRLAAEWTARPRGLVVADFSQAHMRIAAQASQDPQLCEDFRLDRDAHLKLAYDFGVATRQIPADLPEDAFFAWYDKKHPKHKFVKQALRQPAKTGNYTCLNLGSTSRLKQAGDTAKPPVLLKYEEWEIIRDAWKKRYGVLAAYQRQHIRDCNKVDVVVDGEHYGAAWSLKSGRRLWLRKERDKYDKGEPRLCAACCKTHGQLTVKGTDAVSLRWMGTEACAIKHAMGGILREFDQHDAYFMARGIWPATAVWGAVYANMCHDETDHDSRKHYQIATAGCVRRRFAEGLRWAGVVDIPVEPGDAKDADLVVKCWVDK